MKLQGFILVGVILLSGIVLQNTPGILSSEESVATESYTSIAHAAPDMKTSAQLLRTSGVATTQSTGTPIDQGTVTAAPDDTTDVTDSVQATGISGDTLPKTESGGDILSGDTCTTPSASIVLAKDLDDGEVFFEKNSNHRWPIASITKLMAAVVVMDQYDFSQSVAITQEMHDAVAPYATFKVGEQYSINDLVRAAIVASSNDAAYGLASVMGEKEFIKAMNDKAQQLGMSETLYWEPSGLSYLNQSTANDLFKLMRYIYHTYPTLLETSRRSSVTVRDLASGTRHTLKSTDAFAGTSAFYGGKTGTIDESGQNLLTLFEKNGKLVMMLVMGSSDRFGDVEHMYDCLP
jgi:D-alanyl-D-alanine carboxypeptidase